MTTVKQAVYKLFTTTVFVNSHQQENELSTFHNKMSEMMSIAQGTPKPNKNAV